MLDQIIIREISVTKQEGAYTLEVTWKTICEGTGYKGTYQLVLMNGETPIKTWDVGKGGSCKQKVDAEIAKDISYRIKMGGTEGGGTVYSESEPVLFSSFEKVRGNFDGETLHLCWDFREDITFAGAYIVFARAVSPDGTVIIGEYGDNYLDIPIHMDMMKAAASAMVKLVPYIAERSRGPVVTLHFLPWQMQLDSIEKVESTDQNITVTVKQRHSYTADDMALLKPELQLYYMDQQWKTSFASAAASGTELTFSFEGAGIDEKILGRATALLCTGSSETTGETLAELSGKRKHSDEFIPLGMAGNIRTASDAANTEVGWDYIGEGKPSHYELLLSSGTSKMTADTAVVLETDKDNPVSVRIRPHFGNRAGLWSRKAESLYNPGYFLHKENDAWHICLGLQNSQPQTLTYDMDGEIFNKKVSEAVSCNGIQIAPKEAGGYVLTVTNPQERTDKDYDDFLSALFAIGGEEKKEEGETVTSVLPEFLGWIQDLLAEMSDCDYGRLLHCAYGQSIEGRCIDLKSGMGLVIEAEGYKPASGNYVQGRDGEYLPGYHLGATSFYTVHSYGSGEGWKLGFDAFLAGIKEYTVQKEGGVLVRQNADGGLIDLFQPEFRKPLYRLHYPVRMLDSQETGSDYAPANVCLVGAATYGQLVEVTEEMNQEKKVTTPGVTLSYFRGRSVMVPKISVTVNGASAFVSVGTTLQNVLEQQGIDTNSLPEGISMERICRLSAKGFLPVYFPKTPADMGWLRLPLLAGDRISVCRERI